MYDTFKEHVAPERYSPAIGLRPGGERPDLEPLIVVLYAALYESIASHSRLGLNVAVNVGHHDAYAVPRGILADSARRLNGLPVLLVGVRYPSRSYGNDVGTRGSKKRKFQQTLPCPTRFTVGSVKCTSLVSTMTLKSTRPP